MRGESERGEKEKLVLDVAQFEIVLKLWLWLVARGIVMPHVSPNMPATETRGNWRDREGRGDIRRGANSKLSGHMHCVSEIWIHVVKMFLPTHFPLKLKEFERKLINTRTGKLLQNIKVQKTVKNCENSKWKIWSAFQGGVRTRYVFATCTWPTRLQDTHTPDTWGEEMQSRGGRGRKRIGR